MSKVGLMTNEEGKFFAKVIAEEIPVGSVWQTGLKLVLPSLINSLDDKVGDKLPEPWQTYVEDLVTILYNALQDKVVTEEEINQIIEKCSKVLAAEIKIPGNLIDESTEEEAFMFLLKFIASTIKKAFEDKKQ